MLSKKENKPLRKPFSEVSMDQFHLLLELDRNQSTLADSTKVIGTLTQVSCRETNGTEGGMPEIDYMKKLNCEGKRVSYVNDTVHLEISISDLGLVDPPKYPPIKFKEWKGYATLIKTF